MTELFETVASYLETAGYEYRLVDHDPVHTAREAREALGHAPAEGTKSLVLDVDGRVVVATVPAPRDVPFERVAAAFDATDAEFCDPSVVESRLGTELGGVSPFGYGDDAATLVDPVLFERSQVYFNPGRNDVTAVVAGGTFRSIAADWSMQLLD